MSDSTEDKALEEYLRRKSALSMGYRKIYIEAPPPELDRAIAARARRALRWLVPGLIAAVIAGGLAVGLNVGVNKFMHALVGAQKHVDEVLEAQKAEKERERLSQPVTVVIDAKNIEKQTAADAAREKVTADKTARDEWLAKIDALKRAGKKAEADAELKKLQAAFPDASSK